MRTCITTGNVPCTKCCEVIGIVGRPNLLQNFRSGKLRIVDTDKVTSLWKNVSKRRAKKINKYAVNKFPNNTGWFKCKNLTEFGCKDQDNKPQICKSFSADLSYSPTCPVDSRVFFRTGGSL